METFVHTEDAVDSAHKVREAAKKEFFFSGSATKRRGGKGVFHEGKNIFFSVKN